MSRAADLITRRQALARVAYLLGGTLSAPTIAAVLAGCRPDSAAPEAAWLPRTLSPEQSEMVLVMGEHILPGTDTPGARAAQVDRFIDAMLTDYYTEPDRQRFMAGLQRAEDRARRAFGKRFLELPTERQLELVQALNRATFREQTAQAPVPADQVAPPADPVLQEHDVTTETDRVLPAIDTGWDPQDSGPGSFFGTFKELVLVGYYTSEVGATQELGINPMGVWRSDIPYAEVGHAWA